MPKRGSAQLLLLSFRSRSRLRWPAVGIALALAMGGLLHLGGQLTGARANLAELFRQSAWEHALAGLPTPAPWPWADDSAGTTGTVSQLGLSASVVKAGGTGLSEGSTITPVLRSASQDPHLLPAEPGVMDTGDRFTVKASDGGVQICGGTGGKVVDPHLADLPPSEANPDSALATCLVAPATQAEPPAPESGVEHKL